MCFGASISVQAAGNGKPVTREIVHKHELLCVCMFIDTVDSMNAYFALQVK